MRREDGSTDSQQDRLWQQISGASCAPGVSQTVRKGGNAGFATLSFVSHTKHVLHMGDLSSVGMENLA